MMNISIRLWLVGGQVDWTRKTSSPRTFSSILTKVSPSGKELTVHWPKSRPIDLAMARASGGLDVPVKIFTSLYYYGTPPPGGRLYMLQPCLTAFGLLRHFCSTAQTRISGSLTARLLTVAVRPTASR